MFIGCPDANFQHPIESLGGVRIITNYIRTNKVPGRSRGNSREDLLERIEAKASGASFISVSHRDSEPDNVGSSAYIAVKVAADDHNDSMLSLY
jgi:hypothetical protein